MSELRQWLDAMREADRLVRVGREVDPYDYEAAAFVAKLGSERGLRHAVLFDRPRPLSGESINARLLFNVYGEAEHIAIALGSPGASWSALLEEFASRMHRDIVPEETHDVPVQDVVLDGAALDVSRLPFARHVEMEGGPYFTPVVVARKPHGTRYNLSWNRCMFLDEQHVALHISPRQLWSYVMEAEELDEPLPLAIVLGHHPLFNQAAASLVSMDRDEYAAAGGLMGEPVRLAPSVTFGPDLMVPADAEILLEGELLPGVRTPEGPFGEYLRYVGPQKLSNVIRVRAITHRVAPIITEILASYPDHLNASVGIEASLLETARRAVPTVTGVSWSGMHGPTTLVIALRKTADGLAMRAAFAVLSVSNFIKQVIVVDDDIDPRDPGEVLWAVSTRMVADRDIVVMRGLQGALLDPSLGDTLSTSGVVIDATMPLDRPYPARATVPAGALAAMDLSAYLDQGEL